jgi:hypothetical protein
MKFSTPQMEVIESDSDITLFLAGVGSGKSHTAGLISYRNIQQYPKCRGFIGANTYDQLNTSTMFRIREVWKDFGVTEWTRENKKGLYVVSKTPPPHFNTEFHNFDSYHNILSFANGAIIFLASLENSRSHEGKEFAWAILDETKDTRETDVKEIILARLRQTGMGHCPLYIFTSPAKVQWLNEWFDLSKHMSDINTKIFNPKDYFVSTTDTKKVIISSTYHNAHNLPENYISNILENNTIERGKALIYGNPFLSLGGEYYSSFSHLETVSNCNYNPELSLHISFDQNVVPYTPAGIFQIEGGDIYTVNMIDEIAMEHPNNTTEHLCRKIMRKYGNHQAGVFIYGDATGQRRIGLTADKRNHYDIIAQVLRPLLNNHSLRVTKSNEANTKRRDYMNAIFEGKLPIEFNISPNCKLTIDDFTFILQDATGGKKKEKDKDGAEKFGHFSDLTEYFFTRAFDKIYNNYVKYNNVK